MDPFGTLLGLIIVFGPIIGFIPQYNEIKRSRDPNSFSTLICFILLSSNILRIFFWFGKRFEYSLLLQSIVMIMAQLLLLELIVKIKKNQYITSTSKRIQIPIIDSSYISNFWNWDNFEDYLSFLIFLIGILTIFTIFNGVYFHSMLLFEFIGSLSLIVESTLGMPQLYRNWVNKSAKGLRFELILSWFAGDIFKTVFFISRKSPFQFIACGIVQIIIDLAIMSQMMYYNDGLWPSSRLPSSEEGQSSHRHQHQYQHHSKSVSSQSNSFEVGGGGGGSSSKKASATILAR